MAPIISFVGKHNSGKTTLLTGIINILEQRGIRTAIIKHASSGMDLSGERDSDRLFTAGASKVYATSPGVSLIYRREENISLEKIYKEINDEVDLVITEGFKKESFPKIEVLRREISTSTLNIENVIARVTNFPLESSLPCFAFGQQEEITDFIRSFLGF